MRSPRWLIPSAIAALLLVGVIGWWFFGPDAQDPAPTVAIAAMPNDGGHESDPARPDTAILVGDSAGAVAAQSSAPETDDPLARLGQPAATGSAPSAEPVAASTSPAWPALDAPAAPGAMASTKTPSPRRTAAGPRSARATRSASVQPGDENLLATLLDNIYQGQSRGTTTVGQPQTMDELVEDLLKEDASTASVDGIEQSSAKLQSRMRNCPPANTVQGISCRQKLCAKLKQPDPACPSPQ
ncbi:hypothetical protein CSC70_03105 [Pseudoxanthomonas kalamensis DSM 18571]|uniref:hypothetical protein n=1 Tax=Pseudoxanthomonas kalamensis TaxID=289483 RepID=UPI001391A97B|nr:hypothetical protein [Pseudoxanthomonas kalamensis]KAF1712515.1 hypothetical protein CSC70_03105 [Pseudoxanthomonas kalamensis DSM 18571]